MVFTQSPFGDISDVVLAAFPLYNQNLIQTIFALVATVS